ncbi:MAG: DUF448 domain-containing protein [Desulfobulbus sp.]|nr:DUF448 domain-containing protein [Desulfobulbus sp.]
MRRGHVPIRTCRGCGRKVSRATLLRFVLVEGNLAEDLQTVRTGRGVYCCNDPVCRARLMKSKKIGNRTEPVR